MIRDGEPRLALEALFVGVVSAVTVVTLGLACQAFENPRGPILCESWCSNCVGGVCDGLADNDENQNRSLIMSRDGGADATLTLPPYQDSRFPDSGR